MMPDINKVWRCADQSRSAWAFLIWTAQSKSRRPFQTTTPITVPSYHLLTICKISTVKYFTYWKKRLACTYHDFLCPVSSLFILILVIPWGCDTQSTSNKSVINFRYHPDEIAAKRYTAIKTESVRWKITKNNAKLNSKLRILIMCTVSQRWLCVCFETVKEDPSFFNPVNKP